MEKGTIGSDKEMNGLKNINNYVIKSQVLISDGWVNKFPKSGFKRKIGQQITRWSCFPTTLEISNFLWFGKKGKKQEELKDLKVEWQAVKGERRWLMPYDKKTIEATLDKMDVSITEVLAGKDITKLNMINKRVVDNEKIPLTSWIVFFHRFSLPDVKPKGEVNHATVLVDLGDKPSLIIPGYNGRYKTNKKRLFTYASWKDMLKREPSYALLVHPKKYGKSIKLNKLKMWWL